MKEKRNVDEVCPHCGFDMSKYCASDFQLAPFTELSDGRYIIGKVLGTGGFGITYIAFDKRLEVPVAIKELFVVNKVKREIRKTVLMDTTENGIQQYQELKRRFMQEAKTMAELENVEGVVKVKDYFQENNTAYIVMEYLDGKTLKELVREGKKKMSVSQAVTLFEPIMHSLSKMHKVGIIHRDISLDNIMITKDHRVKLIDLGGEKRLGNYSKTDRTAIIKKSVYTPVEQILGKSNDIGPWTDVYALAVTIYRCICGIFPKESGERENDKDIQKPSKLGVHISKKQEETLLKALAINPKNRIQTVDQLLAGLKMEKKISKWPFGVILIMALGAGTGVLIKEKLFEKQLDSYESILEVEETNSETQVMIETKGRLETEPETTSEKKIQTEADTKLEIVSEMETDAITEISNYDQALFYQQRNSLINIQTGDSFLFGEYEQDNNPSNGKEQIEWEVLDKTDDKIFVISKKALCCYPYLSEYENTTWADSEMRSWLNQSFYQDAFSSYHQEMILDTEVTADRNPEYSTDSGSDTNDKIYLLSIDEVKKYFNSQSSRMCQPTVYAKVQGSYLLDSNSWWWLRTPGKDGEHISLVYTDGEIVSEGFRTYVTDGTVRPVMWLDLSAVENVDVPAKLLENEKQNECKGIIAISPSAIGVEDDEVFWEPMGPGAEPEEYSYTLGGIGATTGAKGYDINLQVSKELQRILLNRGYQVVMLRENNQSKLTTMYRALAATESGADILVIVSCRRRQDIGQNGAMAYVQKKTNPYVGYMYDECHELAECLLSEYCDTGIFSNNGIYETNDLRDVNWSKIPVANILLGCLTDISDEQKLADQSNWNLMAEGIANGIDKYFDKADLERGNAVIGDFLDSEKESPANATKGSYCPSGVNKYYFNGHTYAQFNYVECNLEKSYSAWEDYCESMGGHLATITSADENDAIYQMIQQEGLTAAFFGYSDEKTEGNWEWITGEKSTYRKWEEGQPNNGANDKTGKDQNYGIFSKQTADGKWDDSGIGDHSWHFICEWDENLPE